MAPRALARTMPRITRPTLAKHGAAFATLIAGWSDAVGPALAELSLPERLARPKRAGSDTGGTLTVRVASGSAALEFQHLQSQLIERINGFLGFAAVTRIALRQAPVPGAPPPPSTPRPIPAAAARAVADSVAAVEDPELRAALERLGRALAGSKR